jgi:ATP-dependent RNA helicase HelY
VRIPVAFSARSPRHRRDLASTVRNRLAGQAAGGGREGRGAPSDGGGLPDQDGHDRPGRDEAWVDRYRPGQPPPSQPEIARLRRRLRQHPCHACPDREDHARQAERHARLEREVQQLEATVAGRSHVIARTFQRVCAVLGHLGYLEGDTVTPDGRRLADLYTELDLLAAECLRRDLWSGLDPAELAACVSALTFEARKAEDAGPPRLPGGPAREVLAAMVSVWAELTAVEKENKLAFLREPDLGFAWAAHAWARGKPLESVLGPDLTPGDFVRAVKQLMDLLGQIAVAAGRDAPLAVTARQAAEALRRGVVAYSSVS